MKPYVEAILAEEQAGFRPERSTVEQVFALKMLIQYRIEKKNGKVFAVFIDYKGSHHLIQGPYRQCKDYIAC